MEYMIQDIVEILTENQKIEFDNAKTHFFRQLFGNIINEKTLSM